ncbi:hypothetical protein RhiirC2_799831 [Rhizophagus irregularis]|uniref:Uncharacterized protein n=1 Tax=Rhizophagus irregularis TaxID=588596 RepID=A0A2N1M4E1_9GLOM|nr:hypothetical protein RhiirC2_799831 [Rhizophagus irregularis]
MSRDNEAFELQPTMQHEKQEGDPEIGPGSTTQAHREGYKKEDIHFEECPVVKDLERPHRNHSSMTKWVGKVPSSNNPKYAFNKQQAKQTKYADVPYIPQFIGASNEAITGVLQEELCRKIK